MRPLDFWHIGLILTFPVMAVLMLCAYIYNLTLIERLRRSQPVSDRYIMGLCWTLFGMCGYGKPLNEVWKPVVGYESNYAVSNFGRVKRLVATANAPAGKILSLIPDNNGYLKVHLHKNGVGRIYCIHRIVMAAFEGPVPEGMEVNHVDGNKENNQLINLEYITKSQNMIHAHMLGLKNQKGEKNNGSKLTNAEVGIIKQRLAQGEMQKDIAKDYGVSIGTVGSISRGLTWKDVLEAIADKRIDRAYGPSEDECSMDGL